MPPRSTDHHGPLHHPQHNKTFPDAPADVSALLYFASLLLGLAVAVAVVVLLRQYYCAHGALPGGLRDGSSPHPDDIRPPPWFVESGRMRGARRPRPAIKTPMVTTTTTQTTKTPATPAEAGRGRGGEGLDMAAVAAPPLWGYGAMYHTPVGLGDATKTGDREDEHDDKMAEDSACECGTPA